jgi:ABC-type bacteriocin/lantibiotic exporter with double-glycine peptidase domain
MERFGPAARTAVLAACVAAGCALRPGTARPVTYDDLRAEEGWTLLEAVPFVPQRTERDCGAACLAMVMAHAGVEAPAGTLERECAVEGVDGLRAADLREAACRRGLAAFVFAGGLEDLRHELARGRPVVVGLLKSFGPATASHYEVVVGLNDAGGRVAVLDPALGLACDALPAFEDEWRATGRVTLVVFRPAPGTVPGAGSVP